MNVPVYSTPNFSLIFEYDYVKYYFRSKRSLAIFEICKTWVEDKKEVFAIIGHAQSRIEVWSPEAGVYESIVQYGTLNIPACHSAQIGFFNRHYIPSRASRHEEFVGCRMYPGTSILLQKKELARSPSSRMKPELAANAGMDGSFREIRQTLLKLTKRPM